MEVSKVLTAAEMTLTRQHFEEAQDGLALSLCDSHAELAETNGELFAEKISLEQYSAKLQGQIAELEREVERKDTAIALAWQKNVEILQATLRAKREETPEGYYDALKEARERISDLTAQLAAMTKDNALLKKITDQDSHEWAKAQKWRAELAESLLHNATESMNAKLAAETKEVARVKEINVTLSDTLRNVAVQLAATVKDRDVLLEKDTEAGMEIVSLHAQLAERDKALADLTPRALFGDQCMQDDCEGAFVFSSVHKEILRQLEGAREALVKAADVIKGVAVGTADARNCSRENWGATHRASRRGHDAVMDALAALPPTPPA